MLAAWRDTAPAAPRSLGRTLCLQAELAPGTKGPSSPISPGVPSSLCPLNISGPPVSPGSAQENAVVSFYSCPAIIFSQLRITLAKSSGSFYCFRQGFPFSPSPGKFLLRLGLHRLGAPSLSPPTPSFISPGKSTLPCPIHPWDPFTPREGVPYEPPPSGGGVLRGGCRELGGHRAVLRWSWCTQQQNALPPLIQATAGSQSKKKRVA